ncbi:MAG: ATP-dependent helicase [Phycisphaerae bacterium]|nr:ATP-dependent helicase [Phycisphaerae bacterium]
MTGAWLDELNPAQREAVTHTEGPLLVIAGAGTGKTRTLACRVACLIDRGVPADRILLLTFTRRAAAEMLSRAGRLTSQATAGHVWGGTFHAVGNRLLRIYGEAIGLSRDFTVMDQGDAADLMNLIRGELGLAKTKRRFPRKQTLVAIYSRTVNAQDKLAATVQRYFPWCVEDLDGVKAIFELYVQRKRERNVFDYDDLLLYWEALCAADRVGDAVADRFDHILVDEYQDTNAIQGQIIRLMCKRRQDVMVVGDDAQSIYSFRAATIRNILDFPELFPGTRTVTLEQNYRSTQPILAASNAVMASARERFTKELWSDRASDRKPVLFTCMDEDEQCNSVCDRILEHLERGIPLQRQAVLFRAGHHSSQLEVELSRRNIPFHKYGGLKFVEAAHVKDLLAMLRILENPYDEISWFRVLQLLDGVGARTAQRLIEALGVRRDVPFPGTRENGGGPVSPLKRLLADPLPVPPAAKEGFEQFRILIRECTGLSANGNGNGKSGTAEPAGLSLAAQVERIRAFYDPLLERNYENPAIRSRDIEQLEQIALRYRSRSRFITDLTLDPPTSTSDLAQPPFLEEDYLILSTIHSAKGCEWDVVHIIHAADGMIPSDMAVADEAGVEEERRLFYVAMTRAKDRLYVYFPLRYYHHGARLSDRHSYAQLTRFLPAPVRALFEQRATKLVEAELGGGRRAHVDIHKRLNRLWED